MPATPQISVVLPAYLSHETVQRSLAALERQSFRDFEAILIDSSPDSRTEQIVRGQFPWVHLHRHPERLYPHAARNVGASLARGEVLVFTDPDCVPEPDWLERLAAHFDCGRMVVGGSLEGLPGWWNRSVQAAKFPWWLPESLEGPRSEIPSGNFALRREAWEAAGGFRGEWFAGDSELCWRLRESGCEIWCDPRARVVHLEHAGWRGFCQERWRRGQDFGRMRIATRNWSRVQCLLRLLASPLAPVVMAVRPLRYAAPGGGLRRWLASAPVQFTGNAFWGAGEALSYAEALWRR